MATRQRKCSNLNLIAKASGKSWGHLMPSYTIVWPSVEFFRFGRNFVSASKIFGMPKNCQKTMRRFIFVLNSCVHLALRISPSWVYLIQSCHLRLNFVWASVASSIFASRRQYECNKKLTDCLRKATRLCEPIAIPSCSHRIIIIVRWHWDGTTLSAKTAEFG